MFTAPVGYDLFNAMKRLDKKYGFINMVQEDNVCVNGLWPFAREFVEQYGVRNGEAVQDGKLLFDEIPDGYVFYNNFEISHSSLWENSIWRDFMQMIDESKGIYMLRWGDAPIHTIAVGMLLTKSDIHSFSDIGYTHFPFVNQLPLGLPSPLADPLIARLTNSTNTTAPSLTPSIQPSDVPSEGPTIKPTVHPSSHPVSLTPVHKGPTKKPSKHPTKAPSKHPTAVPVAKHPPSKRPTKKPVSAKD